MSHKYLLKEVEETVSDARRNLESGSNSKLPPLPPCPGPMQRTRTNRNIIPADRIFKISQAAKEEPRTSETSEIMLRDLESRRSDCTQNGQLSQ
jgi:hypothetical protein